MKPLAIVLGLGPMLLTAPALAHELRPAAVSIEELSRGRFAVRASPSSAPGSPIPRLEFPAHCRGAGSELACGERGLSGEIRAHLASPRGQVLVRVTFLGGRQSTALLGRGSPGFWVRDDARAPERRLGAFAALRLGIEHILAGADHLLFVLGLVLLVRFEKALVPTITAFTVAHSLTLSGAALGFLRVPPAPVEAVIALSILLLSVECARSGGSLSRRFPWLVAFAFGLLHGLGFAGALAEIGIPSARALAPLFFFNLGVELGQLLVLALLFAGYRLCVRARLGAGRLERPLVYVMGTLAAYWSIERVVATFSNG